MRRTVVPLVLLGCASAALAQVHVQGHVNRNGTDVPGHMRSTPNTTTHDNWSARPNFIPYAGEQGMRNPYLTFPRKTSPNYRRGNDYNAGNPRSDFRPFRY